MRISESMRFSSVTRALGGLAEKHASAARQAASGLAVEKPSDDPAAAAAAIRARATGSRIDSQRKTIQTVTGDLELAEATLASASDLFARAHEIALQGGNGSLSANERTALAEEVKNLQAELLASTNTKGARGYIFAGTKTDAKPFAAGGVFSGDSGEQTIDIGSGATGASASGAEAFTVTGGRNVFADLEALRLALAGNDATAAAGTLDGIEASRKQIELERGRVGLTLEKLDNADAVLERGQLESATSVDRLTAADPMEAFSKMTSLEQALERAVAASRQLLDLGSIWKL